jgi:GTPase SAR1 family protein
MGTCGHRQKDPEKEKAKKTIKVAILGTAASGKSTFFKQMQILHCNGFDDTENQNYIRILISNFYTGVKELIACAETMEKPLSKKSKKSSKFFKELTNLETPVTEEILEDANRIWNDEAIQEVWEMRDSLVNFSIINYDYIIKNVERLSAPEAFATNDDIVRCRQRTTGLSDIEFPYGKHYFHLFDVGGQKPERRKWDVIANTHKPTALLFFTSLVDFDIPLQIAEEGKSRMDESLEVWDEIINKEEFENATFILFLNKVDLFEDKIERVNLADFFPDYDGKSLEAASDFLEKLFINRAGNSRHSPETIYAHTTCAIDTHVMGKVFDSVSEEIFKQRLAFAGLDM